MPELIDKKRTEAKVFLIARYFIDRPEREVELVKAVIHRCCEEIDKQPTIEEVRHGRWIPLKGWFNKGIVKCSFCGNTLNMNGVNAGRGDANLCPNCGTDMREGDADNGD